MELFQESLGMRPDVAHVLVLITDGKALDNVVPPSAFARVLGQLKVLNIRKLLLLITMDKK